MANLKSLEASQLSSAIAEMATLAELELTQDMIAALEQFAAFLFEYNQKVNLVGSKDLLSLVQRHFLDGFTVANAIKTIKIKKNESEKPESAGDAALGGVTLIDIGSGGGLPGMILALSLPWLKVTLVDAIGKKCKFLEEAAQHLGLDQNKISVITGRAEEMGHQVRFREQFDFATARAVASLRMTAELVSPFLKLDGHYLAQKTKAKEEEESREAALLLTELKLEQVGRISLEHLDTIAESVILDYRKVGALKSDYPRAWKKIIGA
ncbi:MAG: 16S rRNA (guanine(527)-N(7))-methyltransferase RsmG [Candidatus Melainabacteria bacterium]|uniref:Ribosomal RNA small subunit methyltransferase G n=1 Tax=Candidatus Obscuribacter phosphatis TaxID=1906157 RepID=A0A8J7PF19_9BACT|nr:16S rRNA (guanine(527)-N(7))-methyltransferase RsmG [Candidatus Obscuribacter phosphatis]MCA0314300.1 16S rRNA (guanine(527)-N(7))-methyltransferase RsmG [Candidatus Melainabacteria bacterium]